MEFEGLLCSISVVAQHLPCVTFVRVCARVRSHARVRAYVRVRLCARVCIGTLVPGMND